MARYLHDDIKNSRSDLEFNRLDKTILGVTGVRSIDEVSPADIRFYPNKTSPDYVGMNEELNASEDSDTWVIYKIGVDRVQVAVGTWSGRASLF